MSKKKKHSKKRFVNVYTSAVTQANTCSKKDLNKKYKSIINEIEDYQFRIFESDKKANRKKRKIINMKEREFYTDMEELKCRRKLAKKWEKNGFLDRVILVLGDISPIIKTISKLIGMLILSFLSLDVIKSKINPKTLSKITKVFDIAMAI